MAIAKICGIETEYGIQIRGSESNPILASSLLISSYVAATSKKSDAQGINWDFCDEQPAIDARGFSYEDSFAPEIESHLVNAVLTNGARYYVDHAHPEISTPDLRSLFLGRKPKWFSTKTTATEKETVTVVMRTFWSPVMFPLVV